MTDKLDLTLLTTGVPGLDTILGGGLPELSFNIIGGAPGSGKTTFAQQIMFSLASPGRSAGGRHPRRHGRRAEPGPGADHRRHHRLFVPGSRAGFQHRP